MTSSSLGLFIDRNNTLYGTSFSVDSILVWTEGSPNVTRRLFGNLSHSHSIFATTGGDVYADNGYDNHRLEKWGINETDSTSIMSINGTCGGLFIDIDDSLYCSYTLYHQVWKKPVNGDSNSSIIIAGNGNIGAEPNMLNNPYGIFVDINLSFYVADFGNHRIQLFKSGQMNGTTVAGTGAPGTITLYKPIAVILDADGYIFIADYGHHRIVGSGPNGFRCIAGCTGTNGAAANQFNEPRALSFDSYGNLYVADSVNSRIQKFMLGKNSCGKSFQSLLLFSSFGPHNRGFSFEIVASFNIV